MALGTREEILSYAHTFAAKIARNDIPSGKVDEDTRRQISTARQWLRLMREESPNLEQVNALMAVLERHDGGTAWQEMQLFARKWKETILPE
jgi:hypothetical protein